MMGRRKKLLDGLEAEIRDHIERETQLNLDRGMAPEAARRAALLKFGNIELAKEDARAVWAPGWLDALRRDVVFGLRLLRRSPGFAAVAILTLALGIGATTAIFSLFDAVMLRSLPVRDPQHLLLFEWRAQGWPQGDYSSHGDCAGDKFGAKPAMGCSFPLAFVKGVGAETKIFSGVAAFSSWRPVMSRNGPARGVDATLASGDYFRTLGVKAALGRTLEPTDDAPSAAPVAVLSYAFWQSAFGGQRSVLGQTIFLDSVPFTIVGVAAARFTNLTPGARQDLWVPISAVERAGALWPATGAYQRNEPAWDNWWLVALARLEPGVSRQQGEAAASVFFQNGLREAGAEQARMTDPGILLVPAQQGLTGERARYSQNLYIFFFAAGMILLIACANVAGLLVARGEARQKEIALRLAIGARRGRIVGQLLVESLLLAGAGGILGAVVAYWGVRGIAPFLAGGANARLPFVVAPDWRVLGFTLAVAILSAVFFGLAPALAETRLDLAPALKENAPTRRRGPRRLRWLPLGHGLVIAQVALGAVVLCGAGLLVHTLANLRSMDPGFDPHNVLLVNLNTAGAKTWQSKTTDVEPAYAKLRERLATLPGVTSVSYTSRVPLGGGSDTTGVSIEGQPGRHRHVGELAVSPDFLRTMRIPLVEGRSFTPEDIQTVTEASQAQSAASTAAGVRKARPVRLPALVNEAFVREYLEGANPLGKRIRVGCCGMGSAEIVGVIRDTKYWNLRGAVLPTVYYLLTSGGAAFELRTTRDPISLSAAIREIVQQDDPTWAIGSILTQTEQIDEILWQERMLARLGTFFAMLALLLASIGLYGLLAYEVTRRRREIGIRMALGALPGDVMRGVVRQGILLAGVGAVAGMAASVAVTRALGSLLYGVHPADPLTFAAVGALFLLIALAACWIPARRAMRVDPTVALRYE